MAKKTWTPFTEIEADKFRAAGCMAVYGYFLLLRIAIGYGEMLRTNVRELAAAFGYNDLRAVSRVLKQLSDAGFISYEQGARGTIIRINQDFAKECDPHREATFASVEQSATLHNQPLSGGQPLFSVEQSATLALSKAQQSVEESATLLPYNTKQHNSIHIARANNSGTLFDWVSEEQNNKTLSKGKGCPPVLGAPPVKALKTSKKHDLQGLDKDAGTFRAPLKENAPARQIFAKWYVEKVFPGLYRTATKESTREWYVKRSKALDSVMRFANNDVQLAKDVTLVRLEKLKKFSQREGEDIAPSLDNIAKHWEEDLRSVDAIRQKRARQEQFLRAEAERKEREAQERQKLEDEWYNLTEAEKTAELRRIAGQD